LPKNEPLHKQTEAELHLHSDAYKKNKVKRYIHSAPKIISQILTFQCFNHVSGNVSTEKKN